MRNGTVAVMAVGLALAAIAGCQKNGGGAGSAPQAQANLAALGQPLFTAQGCVRCHSIGGQGGHMGPDLSHEGTSRSQDWIAQKIQNPRALNPGSRMPSFQGSSNDLQSLAGYIASLK